MERPIRLQGTDGIRAVVHTISENRGNSSPVRRFLQEGKLTPEFVELYGFAFAKYIQRIRSPRELSVVVGWDPRDPQKILSDAMIRGLQKAGATVLSIGIVPTPLVPMYQVASNAEAGVMLTASHNPPDQNGIKLFAGHFGIKFFPQDDIALTDLIYQLDYRQLSTLSLSGRIQDCASAATELFHEFHLDVRNHLISDALALRDHILLVDHANGSLRGFAADVFQKIGFGQVIDVYEGIDREINRDCGAAELEGVSYIDPQQVQPGGIYAENLVIKRLFEIGLDYQSESRSGGKIVSAALFDGDGDRFFRLDYDPYQDRVSVVSGDEIAYHIAAFLSKQKKIASAADLFVITVESDLQTGVAAAALGRKPVVVGVGDKWLLLQAILSRATNAQPDSGHKDLIHKFENRPCQENLIPIERWLEELPICEEFSSYVGGEETGHTVTAGYLEDKSANRKLIFAGNGLKSALNLYAATEFAEHRSSPEFWRLLHRPFFPGFKKTLYVYYTDKSKLKFESPIWEDLHQTLIRETEERFGSRIAVSLVHKIEEPGMLYLEVIDKTEEKNVQAAIFIRNSGTEDKTGVYLRGAEHDRDNLIFIGEQLRRRLLENMINENHPYLKAAVLFLDGKKIDESAISRHRLLQEMTKSGLIDEAYQPTELGLRLID
ncbi:MAG: hypothetical protein B6244_09865 [Candidatus Cloacimonetes bacterium 4572_55]|nr:MAG: hypothetical protein B6244_09865 [Candidatus Cloacimonetes bacterium 4572_55]